MKLCELCGKISPTGSGISWYCIDDNAEVELHPRCAKLIKTNTDCKVEKINAY